MRGDWDATKAILEKGRDWIIDEIKHPVCADEVALASRRAEMVLYAEGTYRQTALPGRQCG